MISGRSASCPEERLEFDEIISHSRCSIALGASAEAALDASPPPLVSDYAPVTSSLLPGLLRLSLRRKVPEEASLGKEALLPTGPPLFFYGYGPAPRLRLCWRPILTPVRLPHAAADAIEAFARSAAFERRGVTSQRRDATMPSAA